MWYDKPDTPEWMKLANCTQTDPEVFFPNVGEPPNTAKRICGRCMVRLECLQWALLNDERFGVWGGTSERERHRMKRNGFMPLTA